MSTIRVDNFGPSAGGTTYSARGIAKSWANFNGVTTTAVRDSLNVSSLTDDATGRTTVSLTNNMGNSNYTGSWYANVSTGATSGNFDNTYTGGFGSRTAASYGVWSYGTAGGTSVDSYFNDTVIFGDLA
jgi:hypothetical protein